MLGVNGGEGLKNTELEKKEIKDTYSGTTHDGRTYTDIEKSSRRHNPF